MKKKKTIVLACFISCGFLFSFFSPENITPEASIKNFYVSQFRLLHARTEELHLSVLQGKKDEVIRSKFIAARFAYKQMEGLVEYYAELDVSKINGPSIDFVEEEDPLAFHEPQGFQVIESFIYPAYDSTNKRELLRYTATLSSLIEGLGNNAGSFLADAYLLDAAVEELYRILALGLAGFDSPAARLSLPEAKAALTGVRFIVEAYAPLMKKAGVRDYSKMMLLMGQAMKVLDRQVDVDRFDRMAFILQYLNPFTSWLAQAKLQTGYPENPGRYSLIGKRNHLFAYNNLRQDRYLFDDTVTADKINLGRKLFSDPVLSKNGKRSCASCHQPAMGFTDGKQRPTELDEHTFLLRNTPTLWNAAFQRSFFYDSRQPSLVHLIGEVLGNEKEMNNGADLAASGLKDTAVYSRLFKAAYPSSEATFSGNQVVNAIAMYLRTLVSYNSRFDKHMRGQRSAMNNREVNGFNLFMGKAKCGTCHFVPLFNGSKPPAFYFQESEVIGVPATADTLNPVIDTDKGRFNIISKTFLRHSFKTPTLRNISLTAPYMHNGVFQTLEQVIAFYNKGGGNGLKLGLPNQSLPFDKLNLTPREEKDIILFLKTLTDTTPVLGLSVDR